MFGFESLRSKTTSGAPEHVKLRADEERSISVVISFSDLGSWAKGVLISPRKKTQNFEEHFFHTNRPIS